MAQTVVEGVETTGVVPGPVEVMGVVVTEVDGVVVVVGEGLGLVVVFGGEMGDLVVVVTGGGFGVGVVAGDVLNPIGVDAGTLIPAQKSRKGFRSVIRVCTALGMSCLLAETHDWQSSYAAENGQFGAQILADFRPWP
jgi:hypothetical protein